MKKFELASVESIVKSKSLEPIVEKWGRMNVVEAVRWVQANHRLDESNKSSLIDSLDYVPLVETWLRQHKAAGYQIVFNLTGTILHTNLGRAALSASIAHALTNAATRPVAIEYDVQKGKRGDRERSITERLKRLTLAESGTAVNNNAAGVFLVLNTLAKHKSVIVSRGELVEIGGSFRLPDIMKQADVRLVEVGTTNRTHPADFENAIDDDTALILKVHPSNYSIEGFTEEVDASTLSEIAQRHKIPFCVDLGSGALINLKRFGLPQEPRPNEVLASGADLVTFSGDKLLGGPQAGIIVGKKQYVDMINANPLKRVVRLGKMTLVGLDLVLKAYEDPDQIFDHVPFLKTLNTTQRELRTRANEIKDVLISRLPSFDIDILASESQLGSGSLPSQLLNSIAVVVSHQQSSQITKLEARMRRLPIPVICRLTKRTLRLDMMCATPIEELRANLQTL